MPLVSAGGSRDGNPSGAGGGGEEVQVRIVEGESDTPEQQGPQSAAASQPVPPGASASVAPASVQVARQEGMGGEAMLPPQAFRRREAEE